MNINSTLNNPKPEIGDQGPHLVKVGENVEKKRMGTWGIKYTEVND